MIGSWTEYGRDVKVGFIDLKMVMKIGESPTSTHNCFIMSPSEFWKDVGLMHSLYMEFSLKKS